MAVLYRGVGAVFKNSRIMESINEALRYIDKMTGLKLNLCECFTGIEYHNGLKYFNVLVDKPVSESEEYTKLLRLSSTYNDIKVEPNGYKRLAIYF